MKRDNELSNSIESMLSESSTMTDDEKAKVKSLLNKYKSATYDDWNDRHQFYQNNVEHMVNDCGFKDEELAEAMANDHPTLQQSFMRFVMKFIRKMAAKEYYDARNERSVLLAKKIVESIGETNNLPMI